MIYTMDISTLYVTDDSYPLSDSYYYADSIHINENGYVKLFSMDDIQEFFECDSSSHSTVYSRERDIDCNSAWSSTGGYVLASISSVVVGLIVPLALVSFIVLGLCRANDIPGLSGTLLSHKDIDKDKGNDNGQATQHQKSSVVNVI